MHTLKQTLLLAIVGTLCVLNSCAPKPKQAKTKLNITPSLAIADINMNGGAIVYGERTDGFGSFGKIFRPGQDVIIEMSFGIWNFSVFAYDGSNGPLTGAIECSLINDVDISSESEVVDMKVDLTQCATAGARRVDLNLCSTAQFTSVTSGTIASCNQTSVGVRSWRMRIYGHRLGEPNGEVLDGPCIIESDYTGGSLNRRFPSGLGNTSIAPAEVLAFNSTDCSGTPRSLSFRENLIRPSASAVKVFENNNVLNMVADLEALGYTLDRSPVLATIPNQPSAAENTAITLIDANDSVTGNDTDEDGDAITYTCFYDMVVDGSVTTTTACTTLAGLTFAPASGVINWTPNFNQSGNYEFRIIGDEGNLTGDTIFTINVANIDRPPIIVAIADETVSENVAITQVNAADSNTVGDIDIDGDAITYSCQYDTVVNGSIVGGTNCTSLPGTVSFNTATGVLNWTPDFTAAGTPTYEIEITATSGPDSLTDTELLVINVNNTDRPPLIAVIGDQTIGENSAITQINADDTSGGDTDIDGDTLTYTCVYDTTVDSSVIGTTCTALTGVSFNTATGVLDWTPDYSQAGNYEFKITATGGPDSLMDDEIFAITVNNVDRPPVLAAIADETVEEGNTFTAVNADDTSGGDTDIDGDTITYTCVYDQTVDTAVGTGTACSSLPGTVSFNTTTGILAWTTDLVSQGSYEIKITGTSGALSDDEIFVLTITDTTPVADGILNGTNWALGAGPTHSKSLAVGTWTPSTTADLTGQKLYLYHKTGCSGTPIQTQTLGSGATNFTFHVPFGHTVYSYKLTGIDDSANESAGVCSSDIRVNQGIMSFSGNYTDGVIVGNFLYAMKSRSVDVYDIVTTPMSPTLVSSLQYKSPQSTLNQAEQLKKVLSIGNYIYLVGIRSIGVFDVNSLGTPEAPEFIGRWDHNLILLKDAVSTGTYLFMTDADGIIAWDVSTPATPTLLNGGAEYPTGETGIVSLDYYSTGNRLYTLGNSGIKSYDLTAFPASAPAPEAATPTGMASPTDIGIDSTNQKLYVVESTNNSQITYWDLGTAPSISNIGGSATFQAIKKVGNIDSSTQMLYGCGNSANGGAFNVTAGTPTVHATLNTNLNVSCNTVVGNNTHFYMLARSGVFAGDMSGGVDILTAEGLGEAASGFRDISIAGNRAVTANFSDRVQVLDMTTPHSPKQIGVIDNAGTLVDAAKLVGTTAYTLSGMLFATHNIAVLPSASQIGTLTLSTNTEDSFVFDNPASPTYAFIAGMSNTLMTVSIAGLSEINTLVGTVCAGGSLSDVKYKAGYVYVACGAANTIEIYDASDPGGAGLSLSHTVTGLAGSAMTVTLGTNHAFAAVGTGGVDIIDITNPLTASITANYNGAELTGSVKSIHIDGPIMYLCEAATTFSYDISTVTSPVLKAKYFGSSGTGSVKVRGALIPNQYLYIAKGYDGLEVLDISDPLYLHQ